MGGVSPWSLRYASHMGFRNSETPLFRATVGSLDPVAHVNYAADLGFAGIQYALAMSATREVCDAFGRAVERRNLEAGCMIYAPREVMVQPLWGHSDSDRRAVLRRLLDQSFEVAARIGSRYVAILSGADRRIPVPFQQVAMTENLRWASEWAAKANMILILEPTNRAALPDMLLTHIAEGHAIVQAVNSPHVRLVYDIGHVQIMDGDLLSNLEAAWPSIEMVQIADNPNRTEPGTGEINITNILKELVRRDFSGLVELEHLWSHQTVEVERNGVAWLRHAEETIAAQMSEPQVNSRR